MCSIVPFVVRYYKHNKHIRTQVFIRFGIGDYGCRMLDFGPWMLEGGLKKFKMKMEKCKWHDEIEKCK